MKIAPFPANEVERILTLKDYEILDSDPESGLDDITRLAAIICEVPIAVVSLVDSDRQWFKSKVGLDAAQTSRDVAFCAHAILERKIFEVTDARQDSRFSDNPIVTGEPRVIFYAGSPLVDERGHALGTLCVIDHEPRVLTEAQKVALRVLADEVMTHFRLRKKLKEQNEFVRQMEKLSTSIPGVIYQYRAFPDGRSCFPYASSKIKDIYGVTPDQVRVDAGDIFKVLHPSDLQEVGASIQESANTLALWRHEYRVNHPERGTRWVRGEATPEKLEDGSVLWHGFITDITDEKSSLLTNIQKEKMSTLGEMSSGIAHEINNPLAILKGRIQGLQKKVEKTEVPQAEMVSALKALDGSVERISKIVRGLRNFAREGSGDQFTTTSVKAIIEDSLALCQSKITESEVRLDVEEFDPNVAVQVRPSQISQVIVNLLSNASDAIQSLDEKWIRISLKQDENYVRILVTDSGHGIPENIREKILQPFFTTKDIGKGTGLGLSISLGIMKAHGGSLDLEESCENTRFVMSFPKRSSD